MDGQRRRAGDRSWRRRSDRDGDGRGAERLDLGLGLGEAARGAERPRGVGGGRGERMEAGGERMERPFTYPLGRSAGLGRQRASASNGSFAGLAWRAGRGPCLGRRAAHRADRAGYFGSCLDVSMGQD